MKKKILVMGSIVVVCVILLASYSQIIGYAVGESSTRSDSPLFHVRTERAIKNVNANEIIRDYFGRNNSTILPFPKIDMNTRFVLELLEKVSTRDKKSLQRYIEEVKKYLQDIKGIKTEDNIPLFCLLKENLNSSNISKIVDYINQIKTRTMNNQYCSIGYQWFPGCNIYDILAYLAIVLLIIIIRIVTYTFMCTYTSPCEILS
jgi:hypothetical protein